MNREIKFRGKDREKWHYGDLVQEIRHNDNKLFDGTMTHIRNFEYKNGDYIGDSFPVNSETIGQYTGLHDKNGKEIYEGDIVLTQPLKDRPFSQKAKSKRLRGIVKYQVLCGKNFISEPDKVKYWGAEWDIEIIDKKDYEKYHNYGWGVFFECEVIGNIYDNPELLGGE